MSNAVEVDRKRFLKDEIRAYDGHWFVDHETTVHRWDEELTEIVGLARKVGRPLDDRDTAPDVVHTVVHAIIKAQVNGIDHGGYSVYCQNLHELFQMTAVRSLYEVIACRNEGFREREETTRWVDDPACTAVLTGLRELMVSKNRQYGSSWSVLRSSDMTGTIHAKIHRITNLVAGEENTFESVDDSYLDIVNYCIFCIIRLSMEMERAEHPLGVVEMPRTTEADIAEVQERLAAVANDPLLNHVTQESICDFCDHKPIEINAEFVRAKDFFAEWVTWGDGTAEGNLTGSDPKTIGVLMEVACERQRQDTSLWGHGFDDRNTINDWISYVCRYATDGHGFVDGIFYPARFRDRMLKAAAIAVAAVETYDRLGGKMAPRHYDHQE